jgi:hypothetical protein
MRDVYPQRDVNSRTRGPAITAAGDGLSGVYSAVLHTVPSGGLCKVLVPTLSLTHYYTAECPSYAGGSVGDAVLVAFDQNKQPWLIPQALAPLKGSAWIAPTLINSWVNLGSGNETAGYLKDPLGFVHLKGVLASGASVTNAFVLPAGYRPGATGLYAVIGGGNTPALCQINTAGNVELVATSTAFVTISGITFLAEN